MTNLRETTGFSRFGVVWQGQKSTKFLLNLNQFWNPLPHVSQEASRYPQDGLLEPTWTQVGRMLAPSCLKLGPSWLHVASSWAQVGSKIDSKRVREAVQEAPSRVLGDSWGSLGAKRPSKRRQRCQNGLQMAPKSTKNR